MKPIFLSDIKMRRFTGDTGCSQDHQIGFEDASCGSFCDNDFNFLGIGNKAEKKRRDEVMKQVRQAYPGPSDCAEVETKIAAIRKDIEGAQKKIDTGDNKSVLARWIDAYNTVLAEYTNYYNTKCLAAPAPATPAGPATPAVNTDPIAQTATPSGSASAVLGGSSATPSGTSTGTGASTAANSASTGTGKSPLAASAGDIVAGMKIPKWVWWTAGGLVLAGITAVVIKKNSARAKSVKNG